MSPVGGPFSEDLILRPSFHWVFRICMFGSCQTSLFCSILGSVTDASDLQVSCACAATTVERDSHDPLTSLTDTHISTFPYSLCAAPCRTSASYQTRVIRSNPLLTYLDLGFRIHSQDLADYAELGHAQAW